ncbi:MAG: hypothetical protein HYS04_11050 [Acidobacteria bacterium]|nr:hypothetical protein [Acidobacteriota bacterium]
MRFDLARGGARNFPITQIERIRFGTEQELSNLPQEGTRERLEPRNPFEGNAIESKFAALGGVSGFMGQPSSEEKTTPDGKGRFRHFQNASIYWSPETGAHEVHGAIRDTWSGLGWEKGILGYPVTDELPAANGGRYNHFQHGSIYWHPQTGAFSVYGPIRDKWAALGWERSALGFPVTETRRTPDGEGRFQHFQGGSIYTHSRHGTHAVLGAIRDYWSGTGWEKSWLGYPTSDEVLSGGARQQFFEHGKLSWTPATGVTAERR